MLKTDELSEVKEQFLASLNHELRTPLSGILGMTDLLLETSLTEEQKDYVGAARVCAENLLEILNVTLEFSALSANHIQVEETEFSLQETLAGVLSEFAFKAEAKGLKLIHNFDQNLPSAVVRRAASFAADVVASGGQCREVHQSGRSRNQRLAARPNRRPASR